jgi:FlhB-like protein
MPDPQPEKVVRAVALKFEMGKDEAPQVLAKGQGLIAEKILALAKQKGIPLYEDPELVEVLAKLDLGRHIAPELYQAVAEVLIFIYRMNMKKMESQQRHLRPATLVSSPPSKPAPLFPKAPAAKP